MKTGRVSIGAVSVLGLAVVCAPTTATAASLTVTPGQSIQAAVDAASPGDTIKVMPGDYTETHAGTAAVRITKPLKLLAKSKLPNVKVRILPGARPEPRHPRRAGKPGRPGCRRRANQGLHRPGFREQRIWLRHVKNFKIENNESIDNLENGIWPTLSANGLVKKNVAYGSEDSALWVEASENVRIINNEFHHSPTGLEITVSKNIVAKKNDIHDNSTGIGLYHPSAASLPPLGDDGYWDIVGNHVHDNNEPNTAPRGIDVRGASGRRRHPGPRCRQCEHPEEPYREQLVLRHHRCRLLLGGGGIGVRLFVESSGSRIGAGRQYVRVERLDEQWDRSDAVRRPGELSRRTSRT